MRRVRTLSSLYLYFSPRCLLRVLVRLLLQSCQLLARQALFPLSLLPQVLPLLLLLRQRLVTPTPRRRQSPAAVLLAAEAQEVLRRE